MSVLSNFLHDYNKCIIMQVENNNTYSNEIIKVEKFKPDTTRYSRGEIDEILWIHSSNETVSNNR